MKTRQIAYVVITLFVSGCRNAGESTSMTAEMSKTKSTALPNAAISTTARAGPLGIADPVVLSDMQSKPVRSDKATYILRGLIGVGSAGRVYWGERESDGTSFAVKVVTPSTTTTNEVTAYSLLKGFSGFPQLEDYFMFEDELYMVMTSIGFRIEDLRRVAGGKLRTLPIHTVGSIGVQLVDRVEIVHSLGLVHGDLFPNNLAVGTGNDAERSTLYVFDFGESLVYRDEKTEQHVLNLRKTRLFDIQAISHTILQLLVPGTPFGDYKHWADHPRKPSINDLCQGLPSAVKDLFLYSHTELGEFDTPDYERLRGYMHSLATPLYRGLILW